MQSHFIDLLWLESAPVHGAVSRGAPWRAYCALFRELVTTYLVALISPYLEAQLASIITDLSGEQHVHP